MSDDAGRLTRIFLEACEIPREERAPFLDAACGGDADLRTELEAMLEADDRARAGGGTGDLAGPIDRAAAESIAGARRHGVPDRIGPYRILEKLGEGGMGVVYRAEQTEPVRREVALKIVRAVIDSAGVLARFEIEQQALAMLDHNNVARLYEAGTTEDGRPYFAMELVRGAPITEYCAARKLGLKDRLALFLDVCRGVRHAHRRGVIHRDLKPSNILIAQEEARVVPKVIDFSIAKALGEPGLGTEFRTRTGQVIGTLEYMSPEQAAGRTAAVDTRSDVYALGVVLYELISGRLPHDLEGQPLHEAVRRIAEQMPRSLKRSTTTSADRVDDDLATIVGKCLDKEPDRRYGSGDELVEDLERYLGSRPIRARPPTAAYHLRKLIGRHRVAFGGAILLLLFLVIFSVTVTVQLAIQRRERARADAQARKADRVSQFMGEAFQGALRNLGPQVTVRSALEWAMERLDQEHIEDPEADAEIRALVGNTYGSMGEQEKAHRLLREAAALLERRFGAEDPKVADALQALGVNLYYTGKLDEAADVARRILEIHEKQRPLVAEYVANDLSLLGNIERQRRHLDAAEAIFRREIPLREPRLTLIVKHNLVSVLLLEGRISEARRVMDEILALETLQGEVSLVAFDLASVTCAMGKHAEAEVRFREAIDAERRLNRDASPRLLVGLGRCLAHRRRFAEAEVALRRAADLQQKNPSALPLEPRASGALASVLLQQHRTGGAEPLSQETLEKDRRQFGDDSFVVAADWEQIGAIAESRGRWPEAEGAFRRSLALREKALAPDDLEVGYGLTALAGFLARRARLHEAEPLHVRGLGILEARFDVPTPALAAAKADWSVALDGLGRHLEAEKARSEALTIISETLGADDPFVARLLHDRAASLRAQHRLDEAASHARDAVERRRRLLGPQDPDLAASLLELARIEANRGELEKTRAAAREARAIWSKAEFVEPAILLEARRLAQDRHTVASPRE